MTVRCLTVRVVRGSCGTPRTCCTASWLSGPCVNNLPLPITFTAGRVGVAYAWQRPVVPGSDLLCANICLAANCCCAPAYAWRQPVVRQRPAQVAQLGEGQHPPQPGWEPPWTMEQLAPQAQASKPTSKGSGQQASQQAKAQASMQASKPASKQAKAQASKQAIKPASKQAKAQASKQASKQTSKGSSQQASKQIKASIHSPKQHIHTQSGRIGRYSKRSTCTILQNADDRHCGLCGGACVCAHPGPQRTPERSSGAPPCAGWPRSACPLPSATHLRSWATAHPATPPAVPHSVHRACTPMSCHAHTCHVHTCHAVRTACTECAHTRHESNCFF